MTIRTKPSKITVSSVLRGDFTGDNIVSADDAIYLLYHVFFEGEYPLNQDADYDHDGQVTDSDAVYLLYATFFAEEYPLD